MKKIFAIIGKSSTGKDTLAKMISERMNIQIATSFTTRPKRTNETEGVEYNFIRDEDFWVLHGCDLLAEHTSYEVANGETWHYGLTKEELEKDDYVLTIVNPEGLRELRRIYGDKVCSILVTAPPDVRIWRYLKRDAEKGVVTEDKAEECCRRFLADNKDFKDVKTEYYIQNLADLESVYYSIEQIIRRELAKDLVKDVNRDFNRNPERYICS